MAIYACLEQAKFREVVEWHVACPKNVQFQLGLLEVQKEREIVADDGKKG